MSPIDWKAVEEAFQRAADLPAGERESVLSGLSVEVRTQVERLLSATTNERGIARVVQGAATLVTAPANRVGPWQLDRPVGEGGMGTVYLAHRADGKFEKQAAVKFVRSAMDSAPLRDRFDRERRILAALEHPNIARVLDAGETADGVPYLVMEYVDGPNIVDYCTAKNLPVRERVKLFEQVCAAVEYLHGRLVVHRDLKPGNILVDDAGAPRLLDFGVAKLVEPVQSVGNNTIVRMLTPAYASPEQFRGETAGLATDIYGLGVVLYELLTGTPAFRLNTSTPAEAERVVSAGVTERPSMRCPALRKELRGDLDNIVLKAMRPEAGERYHSARDLSQDLARYLNGRPVSARDYTAAHRLWKFARRHRVMAAVAAVAVISVGFGLVLSRQAGARVEKEKKVARVERTRAEASEQDAQAQKTAAANRLKEQLTTVSHSLDDLWAMHGLPGNNEARRAGISTAEQTLREILRDSPNNVQAQLLLGVAWNQMGYLQARDIGGGLELKQGTVWLLKARDQFRRLARENPGMTEAGMGIVENALSVGYVNVENSPDVKASLAAYDEGLAAARDILKREPGNTAVRERIPSLLAGKMFARLRHEPDKVTTEELAATRREAESVVGNTPKDVTSLLSLSDIVGAQADAAANRGLHEEALARSLEMLRLRERASELSPVDTNVREGQILVYNRLINEYKLLEGPLSPHIEEYAAKMTAVAERMAVDPNNHQAQFDLAMGLVRLGEARFARGNHPAGLEVEESGNAVLRKEVVATANGAWKRQYSNYASVLGDMYREMGRTEDAMRAYNTGLRQAEAAQAAGGNPALGDRLEARALLGLARTTMSISEAVEFAAKAVGLAEKADGGSANPRSRVTLAQSLGQAAIVYEQAGQAGEARSIAGRSVRISAGIAEIGVAREALLRDWPKPERDAVLRLAAGNRQ